MSDEERIESAIRALEDTAEADAVARLRAENERLRGKVIDDAIAIAKGCKDYRGGYHDDKQLDIYYHGIQTVVNALEGYKSNPDGLQVEVLRRSGLRPQVEEQTKP